MPDLDSLLAQARRITEHREVGAEVSIRKAYKNLLKDLQGFLGTEYANNSEDGTLSYQILQKKGRYARFLDEVEKKVIKGTEAQSKTVKSVVNDTYKAVYDGMIDAVKKSDVNSDELRKIFSGIKYLEPKVLKEAVNNPVSGLTLNDTLEKHRAEIVYNIKQTIGIGLQNGDRYETMAKNVAESLDGDYNKAIRIVRTETHRVRQSGELDSILELDRKLQQGSSGMRYYKIWRTSQDERVRRAKGKSKADHRKMQGVEILCTEEFDLGHGVKAMAPGQSGNAANDINCRCRLSFRLKKVESGNVKVENTENAEKKTTKKVFTKIENNDIIQLKDDNNSVEKFSELGKFKEKILKFDSRMSKEYYSAVKDRFSHGSDKAKEVFNKYVFENSVEDADFIGIPHYNTETKKIKMNYASDLINDRGSAVTYFHEHAHLIDDMAGGISKDIKFLELLNDDKKSFVYSVSKANNLKTFPKVYKYISESLNIMEKHSGVSDILQGLTRGGISGVSGHLLDYWNNKDNITSEAFAHMFEAQFDEIRYREMKKVFPNALKYIEDKLKGVL